jgi:hypothetical protein
MTLSAFCRTPFSSGTRHIDRIVTQLRVDGNIILDNDLARTSPLLRKHITPNGSYSQSPREVVPKPGSLTSPN